MRYENNFVRSVRRSLRIKKSKSVTITNNNTINKRKSGKKINILIELLSFFILVFLTCLFRVKIPVLYIRFDIFKLDELNFVKTKSKFLFYWF